MFWISIVYLSFVAVGFVQPSEMNYPLKLGYTGDIHIVVKTFQGSNTPSIKHLTFNICEWKTKFLNRYDSSVQIKFLNSQKGPIYINNQVTKHDVFSVDQIEYKDNSNAYEHVGTEAVLFFMELELMYG